MELSRRSLLAAPAANLLAAESKRWTTKWDRAVLTAAVERMDAGFDPAATLLQQKLGPEYRYHTNLRSTNVHATRDSFEYSLLLLESGESQRRDRGLAIIGRVLALQDTNPDSKWYGLWGYYLEEPASKMSPADWNWADFLGALLLEIEFRHGGKLPSALRQGVREAIRHAAASVRRRNVAMTYTNIAVQGTFVTLAAAEVLNDTDLLGYAKDRLIRFARTVDETGSFAEYNSPAYANVTIANLTRIRMYVKDAESRRLASRIETRAWTHLARHWHAPTRQLAGPMSRCYRTDIGFPLWIQKGLNGAVEFTSLDTVASRGVPGEVALLDYRCPEEALGWFLVLETAREHRELFVNAPAGIVPTRGTTFLGVEHCLGSVNRGNFWVQSRPLLAYWGGSDRPARYLQARLLKDDYDFASGLLYATQVKNYLLAAAVFRSPGGDKHPSLDPVKDAQFTCSRLRLRIDLAGVPFNAPILVNGQSGDAGQYPRGSRVVTDLGGTLLYFKPLQTVFGDPSGRVSVGHEEGLLTLSVDFLPPGPARVVRFPSAAYCAFCLAIHDAEGTLEDYDEYVEKFETVHRLDRDLVALTWKTAWADLGLEVSAQPAAVSVHDRSFKEFHDGKPVRVERLSDRKLV